MSEADLTKLFGLSGKTALVTGGSSGIGGVMIARGLLQAGAEVIISSRKADKCEQVVAELSEFGSIRAIPADLSRQEECKRLAAEVLAGTDTLHILVNNAGATWGRTAGVVSGLGVGQGSRPQREVTVLAGAGAGRRAAEGRHAR